jgi:hypothetical protein
MQSKALVVTAFIGAVVTPAMAEEFYVIQEPETNECVIVTERPTVGTVLGGVVYDTEEAALDSMRGMAECRTTRYQETEGSHLRERLNPSDEK